MWLHFRHQTRNTMVLPKVQKTIAIQRFSELVKHTNYVIIHNVISQKTSRVWMPSLVSSVMQLTHPCKKYQEIIRLLTVIKEEFDLNNTTSNPIEFLQTSSDILERNCDVNIKFVNTEGVLQHKDSHTNERKDVFCILRKREHELVEIEETKHEVIKLEASNKNVDQNYDIQIVMSIEDFESSMDEQHLHHLEKTSIQLTPCSEDDPSEEWFRFASAISCGENKDEFSPIAIIDEKRENFILSSYYHTDNENEMMMKQFARYVLNYDYLDPKLPINFLAKMLRLFHEVFQKRIRLHKDGIIGFVKEDFTNMMEAFVEHNQEQAVSIHKEFLHKSYVKMKYFVEQFLLISAGKTNQVIMDLVKTYPLTKEHKVGYEIIKRYEYQGILTSKDQEHLFIKIKQLEHNKMLVEQANENLKKQLKEKTQQMTLTLNLYDENTKASSKENMAMREEMVNIKKQLELENVASQNAKDELNKMLRTKEISLANSNKENDEKLRQIDEKEEELKKLKEEFDSLKKSKRNQVLAMEDRIEALMDDLANFKEDKDRTKKRKWKPK